MGLSHLCYKNVDTDLGDIGLHREEKLRELIFKRYVLCSFEIIFFFHSENFTMVCPIDFDKNLPKSSCQYACRPRMVHGYPAKNVQIMFDRRQKHDVSVKL